MVYKCKMCGQLYDEAKEGVKFTDLPDSWTCPVCGAPKSLFELVESDEAPAQSNSGTAKLASDDDTSFIQAIASTGEDIIEPAGPTKNISDWSEILLMGAQLMRKPLADTVPVSTQTVIGASAKQPLVLDTPILVSHMSYGALTAEQKTSIAAGAATVGTAVGTGEGGLLEDEFQAARQVIFEYVPGKYSVTDENLQRVGAIEIKIGQSAKPGLGGHLPGAKVTPEIAKMRGKKVGEDIISLPAFEEINTPEDLKALVDDLRRRSGGRPIGIKLAANNVDEDVSIAVEAGVDFVTIDGRGGGTGAAPKIWRDNVGVPTIYAVRDAVNAIRRYSADCESCDEFASDDNEPEGQELQRGVQLIVTGGLRTAADVMKCLAMGADAVALATGVLIAMAAPGDASATQKVANYLQVSTDQLKMMARAMGYDNVHNADIFDLRTVSSDIEDYTDIHHA